MVIQAPGAAWCLRLQHRPAAGRTSEDGESGAGAGDRADAETAETGSEPFCLGAGWNPR